VPFAAGYGVEIGLLFDAEARYGMDGLAQVNLGVRKHRNRSLLQLGVMARQILGAALDRCGIESDDPARLTQFVQVAGEWLPDVTDVLVADRPRCERCAPGGSDRDACQVRVSRSSRDDRAYLSRSHAAGGRGGVPPGRGGVRPR
jgi:hypothetical protein